MKPSLNGGRVIDEGKKRHFQPLTCLKVPPKTKCKGRNENWADKFVFTV